jgi:hypothetical protein
MTPLQASAFRWGLFSFGARRLAEQPSQIPADGYQRTAWHLGHSGRQFRPYSAAFTFW